MGKSKDQISIYFFRNYLATFVIAFSSMIISLMSFYQCRIDGAVQRLLLYDVYTVLYFVLLWLTDYTVFEISKILYDEYKDKMKFSYLCIIFIVLGMLSLQLNILDLFRYNAFFMLMLILVRVIKQELKNRPITWSIIKKLNRK